MKNDRQSMILEIISQENIETQEQLLSRLQERGITSTQATISRDIKQMHLIKEPVGQGVYKYAVSGNRTKLNFAEKLRTIFRESITSIAYAQNIVVIKTMPGLANGAAAIVPTAFDWAGLILISFVLPAVLTWAFGLFFRKIGWIKPGDLTLPQ